VKVSVDCDYFKAKLFVQFEVSEIAFRNWQMGRFGAVHHVGDGCQAFEVLYLLTEFHKWETQRNPIQKANVEVVDPEPIPKLPPSTTGNG
jgi:hypothetical protein